MDSDTFKALLRDLYEGHVQSALPWSRVEPWVLGYIAAEHAKIRQDEWNGLDIAPKEVFRRFAERAGHPVQFDPDGDCFSFVGWNGE